MDTSKQIDLHGLTLEETEIFFPNYLDAQIAKFRTGGGSNHEIRVITGKGNNSKAEPILKKYIQEYLQGKQISHVLSKDGGSYIITIV